MPSPFPGMDPYLESPVWFPNLHHDLIFCIKETLQTRLPVSYYIQSTCSAGVRTRRLFRETLLRRKPARSITMCRSVASTGPRTTFSIRFRSRSGCLSSPSHWGRAIPR
jgi:hypothetical protein